MKFGTKLTIVSVISVLLILLIPTMAIAEGTPSMEVGNSIILDPIGDTLLWNELEAPAYTDIKKAQIQYQADTDVLVFSMNLAGVIPSEPEDDIIIYNWMLDTSMDRGLAEYFVSVSWITDDKWVASLRSVSSSEELVDLYSVTAINGTRIRVMLDMEDLEDYTRTITELNWKVINRPAPGTGNTWDIAPNGSETWAYWSR